MFEFAPVSFGPRRRAGRFFGAPVAEMLLRDVLPLTFGAQHS